MRFTVGTKLGGGYLVMILLLVASGKGLRYLGIALLTLQGTDLLTWTAPL